ncbi:Spy/CpxP family protein refolding chaperone [Bordetella avium]|uniref:Exported protein n=2 Tax=Bordetella avium TaxID=521 RepID=Q2L014_BORA1|nr:periplasmic heavy metal sensor [Bordetella avium]AZY49309.1 hypothetical protein C0J09_09260 [Bordetella avium]AZY52664.1 hypothetical protein C0J07_09245 [Bordetella avium]RIQ19174.1 periplasmic heavy metal sensor [Bordetella avium]RIQ32086.1 periplasmic heavy metal sensor [Bordetella avium]RIQ52742.1 periplasmic heavy metal sensor [Bordetella avium]
MSRTLVRNSLAALAMAIAAGVAVAPATAAPGGPVHAGNHRGPMMDDGIWIPGIGPLSKVQVDGLKLDAKQQALFDKAHAASQAAMQHHREAGRARQELLDAQIKAGKLDPRALEADADKRHAQFEAQRVQVRDQWLAVWDSLNDGQRAQVTQLVKERQDRQHERRDHQRRYPGVQTQPKQPG